VIVGKGVDSSMKPNPGLNILGETGGFIAMNEIGDNIPNPNKFSIWRENRVSEEVQAFASAIG
jgi:hypothetical protein